MTIDTSRFGTNLFRCRMTNRNGVLTFIQPGWLYGATFLVIAGAIVTTLSYQGVEFSGAGIIGYLAAGSFGSIGMLYALYGHRMSLDTARRRLIVERGFIGFVREYESGFETITTVRVVEVRSHQMHRGRTLATVTIDVGLECSTNQPTFDFWRAESREQAMHIAETVAAAIGCRVRFESR